MAETKAKGLVKIQDLYNSSDLVVARKQNQLLQLLNAEPKADWIKLHPFARDDKGKQIKYIPIERVEYLLTNIFGEWRVEVKEYGIIANAVSCSVRLH